MGFAVIHMEKYKANDLRGIQSHNNRERKSKSNQDINHEKSSENYDLLKCDNYTDKIVDAIYKNASESKTIRKDAVVLCSFIITSDNVTMTKMLPEGERDFFEKSFEFISQRYGKENVVSATVHKDEKTPHMHITVVPIKDKRLCAKKLFDRKELSSLQTDFAEKIGSQFEMQRGKEGSDQKHLSEIRFKISKEKEQLELAKEDLSLIKNRISTLENRFKDLTIKLDKQDSEIKNRSEKLSDLTSKIESKNIEVKYKTKRIDILANDINLISLKLNNLRETEKVVREDLNLAVSDFNSQDKQVLNRAIDFIKTLPNEIQERWAKFNIERKRTPSSWAKKLANERKNGLER